VTINQRMVIDHLVAVGGSAFFSELRKIPNARGALSALIAAGYVARQEGPRAVYTLLHTDLDTPPQMDGVGGETIPTDIPKSAHGNDR
jgi:hypothetical protein